MFSTVRGVCDQLPVAGADLILGHDLGGVKVFPTILVIDKPAVDVDVCKTVIAPVFPACVVTRA